MLDLNLGSYESLDIRPVRPWNTRVESEPIDSDFGWRRKLPTPADVIPCPPQFKPWNWDDDPDNVLDNEPNFALRDCDLHDHEPILIFEAKATDEDMTFFRCDGRYYIYWAMSEILDEIVEPDMADPANWMKLRYAPQFQEGGFVFRRVEMVEMLGGPRVLASSDIPEGWGQLDHEHLARLDVAASIKPGFLEPRAVVALSRRDGFANIVEIVDEYYMWHPQKNRLLEIIAAAGLAEILDVMRSGRLLNLSKQEREVRVDS